MRDMIKQIEVRSYTMGDFKTQMIDRDAYITRYVWKGDASFEFKKVAEEEEGDGQERLGVDAVEQLADHRLEADRGERRRHQDARDDRERHRHAHVAQQEEQASHHGQDPAVVHSTGSGRNSSSSGPSKPFCQPLTICSTPNSITRAPEIGTMPV